MRRFGLGFLGCSLLAAGLCRVDLSFFMLPVLWLRFAGGKLGRRELLPVEGDFGDAHRGKWLAMSKDLLVLLLAFEVEDQNLVATPRVHHFAAYDRALARTDMPLLSGDGQHIVELDDVAVLGGQLLNF